jgi:hypothetical protein
MTFITANISLNNLTGLHGNATTSSDSAGTLQKPGVPQYQIFCGDVFDAINNQEPPNEKFDWVLCNPPFVAAPPASDYAQHVECGGGPCGTPVENHAPALYAVGGGIDGMDLLRRIMKELPRHLKSASAPNSSHEHCPPSQLLMVTEVPNVDQSCHMLRGMLNTATTSSSSSPSSLPRVQICVAYVEEDVETVDEYSKERQEEDGTCTASAPTLTTSSKTFTTTPFYGYHDWSVPMHLDGIYNRALVLIAITFRRHHHEDTGGLKGDETISSVTDDVNDEESILVSYSSRSKNVVSSSSSPKDEDDVDDNDAATTDEEDAFLTPGGMAFIRRSLISL